jgi:hypothetical protein
MFLNAFLQSLQRNQNLQNQIMLAKARAGYLEPMQPSEVPPPKIVGALDPRRLLPQYAHYTPTEVQKEAIATQSQPVYWGGTPWKRTSPEQSRLEFLRSIGAIKAESGTPLWKRISKKISQETGAVVTPSSGALPIGKEVVDLPALQQYPGLSIEFVPGVKYRVPKPTIPESIWEQSGLSDLRRNQILGTLRSGYYLHPLTGQRLPLRTKRDAIDYILQRGYINFSSDPEVMSVINTLPEKQIKTQKKGLLLGKQEQAPIAPSMDLSTAETRFNQLVGQGLSEAEAYRKLIDEGF